MQVRNLDAIRRVFEEHGIEFLGLDGVRLLRGHDKLNDGWVNETSGRPQINPDVR